MPTLVLVPGAWHGGWWFEPLARQFVDTNDDGLYHCAACSNPLFDGRAKYHSGTGWPSFTETVSPDTVELVEDHSHDMVPTEVRCARCRSHLGPLFSDGLRGWS
jgi:peptide-methionine (R)-S-oxide reductase